MIRLTQEYLRSHWSFEVENESGGTVHFKFTEERNPSNSWQNLRADRVPQGYVTQNFVVVDNNQTYVSYEDNRNPPPIHGYLWARFRDSSGQLMKRKMVCNVNRPGETALVVTNRDLMAYALTARTNDAGYDSGEDDRGDACSEGGYDYGSSSRGVEARSTTSADRVSNVSTTSADVPCTQQAGVYCPRHNKVHRSNHAPTPM